MKKRSTAKNWSDKYVVSKTTTKVRVRLVTPTTSGRIVKTISVPMTEEVLRFPVRTVVPSATSGPQAKRKKRIRMVVRPITKKARSRAQRAAVKPRPGSLGGPARTVAGSGRLVGHHSGKCTALGSVPILRGQSEGTLLAGAAMTR